MAGDLVNMLANLKEKEVIEIVQDRLNDGDGRHGCSPTGSKMGRR